MNRHALVDASSDGDTEHSLSPGTHYLTVQVVVDGIPTPVIDGRTNPDYQFDSYGDAQDRAEAIEQHPQSHIGDVELASEALLIETHTAN